MPAKVILTVIEGPMEGQRYVFEKTDTVICGRTSDCRIRLTEDTRVSRRHCQIELDPPEARLQDLGSRNGTHLNGERLDEPARDLQDGDRIRLGSSVLIVRIEQPPVCTSCGAEIPADQMAEQDGEPGLCVHCGATLEARPADPDLHAPIRCVLCGKIATVDVPPTQRNAFICESCRTGIKGDDLRSIIHLIPPSSSSGSTETSAAAQAYRVERKLGVGGFGAVYLARRTQEDDLVAIKVMLSKVAVSERARQKFLREIAATERLRHENIVSLLGHGCIEDVFFFIMEYCDQGSVWSLLREHKGRLPLEEAGPIVLDVLRGLAHAHRHDFVHRDIKPHNILLKSTEEGRRAKIADFGLAKNFQEAGLSGMTVTGYFGGSLKYMPREQFINFKYARPYSDVWSVAATFYRMLAGVLPKDFPEDQDPMKVVLTQAVVPIQDRLPEVPDGLAAVLDRALTEKVEDRYQTGQELLEALEEVL